MKIRGVRNLWPAACILGYFGLVILFCNPLYNIPLYDDWAYAGNVQRLLEIGELKLIWTQVSFVGQLFTAGLFTKIFGFSFSTLHVYTLLLGIAGAFAAYALARAFDRSRMTSVLAALALVSTPFYLHFCFTFMTDVPSTAALLLAFAAFAAAERRDRDTTRHTNTLFLISAVFLIFAAMIRDFAFLFVLPAIMAWIMGRRSKGMSLFLAFALPLVVISYLALSHFVDAPYRIMKFVDRLFTGEALRQAYVIISYLGMFLSPLLFAVLRDLIARDLRGNRVRQILWWTCLLAVLGVAAYQYAWAKQATPQEHDDLMPYRPGFISIYGTYNQIPLPGMRHAVIPPLVRFLFTGIGILGGAILLYAAARAVGRAIQIGKTDTRMRGATATIAVLLLGVAIVFLIMHNAGGSSGMLRYSRLFAETSLLGAVSLGIVFLAMFTRRTRHAPSSHAPIPLPILTAGAWVAAVAPLLYYVMSAKFFIRYGLAMVPGITVVLLAVFHGLKYNRIVLICGMIFWTAVSIVWTRDQISFNEARWNAGNWLLAQGVPADEIVGGFEFGGARLEFRGKQPSRDHIYIGDFWLRPVYLLTLDNFTRAYPRVPKPGRGVRYHLGYEYHRVRPRDGLTFPYHSILSGGDREIQIWRTYNVPSQAGNG